MSWFDDQGFSPNQDGTSYTQPNGAPQILDGPGATGWPIVPTTQPAPAGGYNTGTTYNTGGYNTPASITARTGQAPAGWDQTKWSDPNKQDPKYAVAGIIQNAIANGEKNLSPDTVAKIAQAYPGATQINGTSVNIPGIGNVQVMNDGQARWDNINNQPNGGGDTGSGGGSAGGGSFTLGSLGSAGTQTAPNAPQTNLTSGGFNYGQAVPQTQQATYTPFVLPTREEALAADPGFQFGLDQGLGQLGTQASARGSIHDPNYLQGMTKFATDYATQQYGNVVNQLFQQNQANNAGSLNAVNLNNQTALGQQGQGFGQALSGFNANLGALGQQQQYGLGLGNLALGQTQAANSYALGQGNLALGQQNFGLNAQNQYWNQAFNNNQSQFDNYYKLAQLGYPQS